MNTKFRLIVLFAAAGAMIRPAPAQTIDISGTVADSITKLPVPGTIVRLVRSGNADTTDSAGAFQLTGAAQSVMIAPKRFVSRPCISARNRLEFDIAERQYVSLAIHDIRGRLVERLIDGAEEKGRYAVAPSGLTNGHFIYVLRTGNIRYCIPFTAVTRASGIRILARAAGSAHTGTLGKSAGVLADTVLAAKTGYPQKRVAVNSNIIAGMQILLSPGIGILAQENATPEQIGLYLPLSRALDSKTTATLQFRASSEQTWHAAHPLLRINPNWVESSAPVPPIDAFAGTIFDLSPGTAYEVKVTVTEPGSSAIVYQAVFSTRAMPSAAPAPTVTASTSDNLQQKLNSLAPGDVLQLANGTYNVQNLRFNTNGTAAEPIYIRGTTRDGAVVRDSTGTILQLLKSSHVIFENFTLQGSGIDDGTNAGSVGVSFWDGEHQEDVTFRDLTIAGVDMGIVAWGAVDSVLVYNCILNGNNVWTKPFIESNLTWNDDGIRLPGKGNCAFENTLRGFGDAFAVTDGVFSAAVHFYRNLVTMTGDDGFEADYATRNIGFYDNYLTNTSTFLSLDPLWGDPLYCFRNISINTVRGPFKLNNTNSGFVIYNNTMVRTDGTTGWGWVQYNNGSLRNWSYRNNVLIYRGAGNLLAIESTVNDPIDFTNNAWYPDKSVWWTSTGGSFASVAQARQQLPVTAPVVGSMTHRHENDVITTSNPFVANVNLGSDHLTEVTTVYTPTPAAGSAIKGAGVAIPGITDGYSGANPDMGAIIGGRTVPRWGAHGFQ